MQRVWGSVSDRRQPPRGLSPRRWIAERQAHPRQRASTPRSVIARLGAIVACITIVAPPSTLCVGEPHTSCSSAPSSRPRSAPAMSRCSSPRREPSTGSTQVSINVVHATQGANSSVVASWVTDTAGSDADVPGALGVVAGDQCRGQDQIGGVSGPFQCCGQHARGLPRARSTPRWRSCSWGWRPTTAFSGCRSRARPRLAAARGQPAGADRNRRRSSRRRTCASTRRSTTCRKACACSTASTSWSSATRPTPGCTACPTT